MVWVEGCVYSGKAKNPMSFRADARSLVGIQELKVKDEPAGGQAGRNETPRIRSG